MHDYISEQLGCQISNYELTTTCKKSRKQRSIHVFIMQNDAKFTASEIRKKHGIVNM